MTNLDVAIIGNRSHAGMLDGARRLSRPWESVI